MSSARDISAIMRKVRASDTTPEMRFRKALWAEGLRYKPNSAKLPGKPDVVLAAHKTIIFIFPRREYSNHSRRLGWR